jgi:acyl carrier protein
MYLTGDMGAFEGGVLMYHGRMDTQIKLRGYRIELGEIESALRTLCTIRRFHLVVSSGAESVGLLTAYVQLQCSTATAGDIDRMLSAILPRWALPRVVICEYFPLLPNGKVDILALEQHCRNYILRGGSGEEASNRSSIEVLMEVLRAVADALETATDSVDVSVSILRNGADSLSALRLLRLLHERLGVNVSLRDLFEAASVVELSRIVGNLRQSARPIQGLE